MSRPVLIGGRCEKIRYEKSGEWTDDQTNSLLALNASDQPWKPAESKYRVARREWIRDEGVRATWSSSLSMTFSTRAHAAAAESVKGSATSDAK